MVDLKRCSATSSSPTPILGRSIPGQPFCRTTLRFSVFDFLQVPYLFFHATNQLSKGYAWFKTYHDEVPVNGDVCEENLECSNVFSGQSGQKSVSIGNIMYLWEGIVDDKSIVMPFHRHIGPRLEYFRSLAGFPSAFSISRQIWVVAFCPGSSSYQNVSDVHHCTRAYAARA